MAEKRTKQQRSGTSKNTVAAKQAEAAAKEAAAKEAQAAAEAERAKTDMRRLELEAEARKDKRADERRAADKAPSEQLRQVGLVAAPLAAGMAYGKHKADKINAEVTKAARAKNKQLEKVAEKVRGTTNPAKLRAGVRVADKLKLGKMKGPVGGVTAAFLVTEAVAARVVASNTENETAKEVLNGAAIGLGAAAVSTVGTRMVQRATASVQPNAAAMVDIEAARETSKAKPSKAAPRKRAPRASGVAKTAGRAVMPVLAGIVAVSAFNDRVAAAEARGDSKESARAQGFTEAAKAVTDVVTGGALSAAEQALAEGSGRAEALARGASVGAINLATFGTADMANAALEDKGGVVGVITDTVQAAAKRAGDLLGLSSDTPRQIAREMFGGTAHAGTDKPVANGAEDPSAAAKIGGVVIGGTGGAMVMIGRDMIKERGFSGWDAPPSRATRTVRAVKGAGTIGVGLTLAALGMTIATAKTSKQPKAFLNEGAERKASEAPKAPASTVIASASVKKSDGETAGYSRRGKNGQTIQVQAYRTPDRR